MVLGIMLVSSVGAVAPAFVWTFAVLGTAIILRSFAGSGWWMVEPGRMGIDLKMLQVLGVGMKCLDGFLGILGLYI
jgi:hypothetical protein